MKHIHLKHLFTALLLLCATVVSAHDFEVDGIYYKITNRTYGYAAVTYKGSSYTSAAYSGSVNIPKEVTFNGTIYIVKSIGEQAFYNCRELTDITIQYGVTSIEKEAFANCSGLTGITIPGSVTTIKDYAFQLCTGLTSVTIPNGVKNLEWAAFIDCVNLTEVTIPNSVTYIGARAFSYCSKLEKVTMGNGVTTIDDYAFYLCPIKDITLSNTLTSIGVEAFGCCGITNITLPNSLTTISNGAFYCCRELINIIIPNSVTAIPENAFKECTKLKTVTIGDGVTSIGNNAFSNCENLTNIIVGKKVTSIASNAFYYCNNLDKVINASSLTLSNYDYLKNANIISAKNVVIQDNLVFDNNSSSLIAYFGNSISLTLPNYLSGYKTYSIGNDAFKGCSDITSITLSKYTTSIGSSAFKGCTGLTSITIPSSATTIGSSAFEGCSNLADITIQNGVKSIGSSTFYRCSSLTDITIPNSVTSIGTGAFSYCTNLASVALSENITTIEGSTFYGCSSLTDIAIPNKVTTIKKYAFYGCSSLTDIAIPNKVTTIEGYAFIDCSKLSKVEINDLSAWCNINFESGNSNPLTYAKKLYLNSEQIIDLLIPNDISEIKNYAFYGCSSLESVQIPSNITAIGNNAFLNCNGLKTVINFSNLPLEIGNSAYGHAAYYATNLVNAPNGSIVGDFIFAVIDGENILASSLGNNSEITLPDSYNGENYKIGDNAFNGRTSLTSITIPNSVTAIGNGAFSGCTALTNATIGSSVTTIGENAFYGCNKLTGITIPNSVTAIGNGAFSGCTALTNATIGSSVTTIGDNAFYGCNKLIGIIIPNSVTAIGNGAFSGCTALETVEIGNSVSSIGEQAFQSCSKLTSIIIPSSVKTIGSMAFIGCTNLKIVYNYSSLNITSGATTNGHVAYNANVVVVESDDIQGDFIFRTANAVSTLIAYIGNDTEIALPESYRGNSYRIGENVFRNIKNITKVTIPNSVTIIGKNAFYNCTALANVAIGKGVTTIETYAFYYCSKLTSIEIPSSVTSIEANAFYGCSSLKTVVNDSELNIEKGSTSNGYVAYYANEVIANEFKFEVIDGVNTLTKYKGKGVKQEESESLANWTSTNKGQSSTNSTYKYIFDATAGSKLTFDWSVSSEPNYDWFYVTLDGKQILKKSGQYSGSHEESFSVAGSHTLEVKYSKDGSVDKYDDQARTYNVKLTKTVNKPADVVLPDNYEGDSYVIGESAFENNEFVAGVTIPEGVEMICNKAFAGCSNLENIVIPNSVSAIGVDAFAGTKWYDNKDDGMVYAGNVLYKYKGSTPVNTAITINDGTLGITGLAFMGNSNLTSIEIPASVTNIGNYAFDGCTGLTSITSLIPAEDLFTIDSNVFSGVDKNACTLYVPCGAKEIYAATEGWEDFVNIEEPRLTITINQYGSATFCSDLALDFSNVEGLKAYAATGYNKVTQVVTLTRLQTAQEGTGLFLKGEPGEYTVPVIEYSNDYSLNMLVGTLEQTVVNSTDGAMSNYKFTILPGEETPMFYPFEDGTTLSGGKAYLQIPTAWLPATAQKSLNIRFDDGETTDLDEVLDEVKGQSGEVKTVYDLQGRVVENPTSGIYIIDGKKTLVK